MSDRIICGWRVRSALPLPELAPWPGPDRPVDIEIRPGAVPAKHRHIVAAPDGRIILDQSPHARFLVSPDCVIVDTVHRPEAAEWRVRLLGPVLGLLCYLRRVLPLHASCVRIGARTVAIAGHSCAGKSTLAAALMRRNHVLLTDDICAITPLSMRAMVFPSFPALKLASDSMKTFGIDPNGLAHVSLDTEKFLVPGNDGFDPGPSPLDTVYVIEDAPDGMDDAIIGIDGVAAFQQLNTMWYRAEIGRFLCDNPTLFSMAARLAGKVAVRRLVRRSNFDRLAALVSLIEADAMRD
jgi:hypothetical protein